VPDHEGDIATFLTLDGKVFIASQFNVAFDKELNEGGSCPDFVTLDFGESEIVVVEITTIWPNEDNRTHQGVGALLVSTNPQGAPGHGEGLAHPIFGLRTGGQAGKSSEGLPRPARRGVLRY